MGGVTAAGGPSGKDRHLAELSAAGVPLLGTAQPTLCNPCAVILCAQIFTYSLPVSQAPSVIVLHPCGPAVMQQVLVNSIKLQRRA